MKLAVIKRAILPMLVLCLPYGSALAVDPLAVSRVAESAEATSPIRLPPSGCSLANLAGGYTWNETTRTDYSSAGYSKFGEGWVHAVSVGREINDGAGNITAGQMTINNTYDNKTRTVRYTGKVTLTKNCVGTYYITLEDGESGGGGIIYVDPVSRNFTLLDRYNIGTARFLRDGTAGQ